MKGMAGFVSHTASIKELYHVTIFCFCFDVNLREGIYGDIISAIFHLFLKRVSTLNAVIRIEKKGALTSEFLTSDSIVHNVHLESKHLNAFSSFKKNLKKKDTNIFMHCFLLSI